MATQLQQPAGSKILLSRAAELFADATGDTVPGPGEARVRREAAFLGVGAHTLVESIRREVATRKLRARGGCVMPHNTETPRGTRLA